MVRTVLLIANTLVEGNDTETAAKRVKAETVAEKVETRPETPLPVKGREDVVENARLTPSQTDPRHLILGETIFVKTITAVGPSPLSKTAFAPRLGRLLNTREAAQNTEAAE